MIANVELDDPTKGELKDSIKQLKVHLGNHYDKMV
jgi:hypothetical protein